MPEFIIINGRAYEKNRAVISVFDHGFLYGDGLFTTIRVEQKQPLWFDNHWLRLSLQARQIYLNLPWSREELWRWVQRAVNLHDLEDAYVRVSISRGEGPLGLDFSQCNSPNCIIYAKPLPDFISERQEKGIKAGLLAQRHPGGQWAGAGLKALNFLNQVLAVPELKEKGWQEGIYLDNSGYLAEGTVSNIFWIIKDKIYTPALSTGILNGIMRQKVIEIARSACLDIEEGLFGLEALEQADEIFITNCISEIVPVIKFNSRQVGSGKRGPAVERLQLELKKIKKNC